MIRHYEIRQDDPHTIPEGYRRPVFRLTGNNQAIATSDNVGELTHLAAAIMGDDDRLKFFWFRPETKETGQ